MRYVMATSSNSSRKWLENAIANKEINCIEYGEFNEFVKIFEGPSSSIHKAEWANYGLTVALKTLKDVNLENDQIEEFVKELKLLQSGNFHPNLNHLYGVTMDPSEKCYKIVLQFANDENLREYLKKNFSALKWIDKLRIAMEVAKGLIFLHRNGIIHRDLHSRNILIHEGKAMIADFGLAKQMTAEISASTSFVHGITAYIEPQCFKDHTYRRDFRSDVYSYGVILWEISSGQKPFYSFKSRDAITIHIFKGNREKPVEGTSPEYIKLYTQCWDEDPKNRPEMKDALDKLKQFEQLELVDHNIITEEPSKGLLEKAILDQGIKCCNFNEFSDFKKIAVEEFGSVSKSTWKGKKAVALKCLKVNDNDLNDKIVQEFINKLQLLQKVTFHSNIIKFYGVTKDSEGYYNMMILQFAEGGNLRDYLKHNFSQLSWDRKLHIAKDITEGLSFLHRNDLAHRDLHPKNILVHEEKMTIAGFGISEQMNEDLSTSRSIVQKIQAYIEPQCFREPTYKRDKKSDIYSLGVILWEISSGTPPFGSLELGYSIPIRIFKGEREKPIKGTPPHYIELYIQCWDDDPVKRPKINSVLDSLEKLLKI